jgi:hypothetical protein
MGLFAEPVHHGQEVIRVEPALFGQVRQPIHGARGRPEEVLDFQVVFIRVFRRFGADEHPPPPAAGKMSGDLIRLKLAPGLLFEPDFHNAWKVGVG